MVSTGSACDLAQRLGDGICVTGLRGMHTCTPAATGIPAMMDSLRPILCITVLKIFQPPFQLCPEPSPAPVAISNRVSSKYSQHTSPLHFFSLFNSAQHRYKK
eukprot:scpid10914/ scgid35152/ 